MIDQTWTFESGDPVRRKFKVGSTARHVVAWRCDWGVETRRPVHSYFVLVSLAHTWQGGVDDLPPTAIPFPLPYPAPISQRHRTARSGRDSRLFPERERLLLGFHGPYCRHGRRLYLPAPRRYGMH